jgi:hypothetical protein
MKIFNSQMKYNKKFNNFKKFNITFKNNKMKTKKLEENQNIK